ncbi:hypothetical protein AAAC51_36415 [Priestia megaterium]
MNMPDLYSADEITRKAYEEGFQSGRQEQAEKLKKEYKQEGYKQGYALQTLSVPSGLSSEIVAAFEKAIPKAKSSDIKMCDRKDLMQPLPIRLTIALLHIKLTRGC